MVEGPAAALLLLNQLEADGQLVGYHLLAAMQADCLRRLNHYTQAADYYRKALNEAKTEAERTFLAQRLDETVLLDVTSYGRQEEWEDSPAGWPQRPTYG